MGKITISATEICSICGKSIYNGDDIVVNYIFPEGKHIIPRMEYTHKNCREDRGKSIKDRKWF